MAILLLPRNEALVVDNVMNNAAVVHTTAMQRRGAGAVLVAATPLVSLRHDDEGHLLLLLPTVSFMLVFSLELLTQRSALCTLILPFAID